jgi:hypothetical protein
MPSLLTNYEKVKETETVVDALVTFLELPKA